MPTTPSLAAPSHREFPGWDSGHHGLWIPRDSHSEITTLSPASSHCIAFSLLQLYKPESFTSGGFRHHELFFPDGSCPSSDIVLKFLSIVEEETAALAVHCKAGLGRTGVLICCYIMKHYSFTAREVCPRPDTLPPSAVLALCTIPRHR